MNQIFDSQRFLNYMRKYAVENRKKILYSLIILLFSPIFIILTQIYLLGYYDLPSSSDRAWSAEVMIFDMMFVVYAAAFGAAFFEQLSTKQSRISFLTFPASNFEKFLNNFLIYGVAFVVVFICTTFFADCLRVWLGSAVAVEGATVEHIPLNYILMQGNTVTPDNSLPSLTSRVGMFALTSVSVFTMTALGAFATFMLGSSVWPKRSFVKTLAFIFIFNMVWSTIAVVAAYFYKTAGRTIHIGSNGIDAITSFIIFDCVAVAICIIFMLTAYLRMKEWEVINRW